MKITFWPKATTCGPVLWPNVRLAASISDQKKAINCLGTAKTKSVDCQIQMVAGRDASQIRSPITWQQWDAFVSPMHRPGRSVDCDYVGLDGRLHGAFETTGNAFGARHSDSRFDGPILTCVRSAVDACSRRICHGFGAAQSPPLPTPPHLHHNLQQDCSLDLNDEATTTHCSLLFAHAHTSK